MTRHREANPMTTRRVGTMRSSKAVVVLAALLLLAACGGGNGGTADTPEATSPAQETDGGQAAEPEFEWDYALFLPLTHELSELAQEFADDVLERTNGRLEITLRPAGELPYSPDEFVRRVGDGSVQIADATAVFISGDCRPAGVTTLPFLLSGREDFQAIWEDTLKAELESQCWEPAGAQLLYHYLWPQQNYWGQGEPIESMEGFDGRVVRQNSPWDGRLAAAFGAETVTIPTAEVPTAMQRGVVEAVLTTGFNIMGSQWFEFLDWGFVSEGNGVVPGYIIANAAAYEELPDDVRQGLDEAAQAAHEKALDVIPQAEEDARQTLQDEHGIEIFEASEEGKQRAREIMEPIWDEWTEGDDDAAQLLSDVKETVSQ